MGGFALFSPLLIIANAIFALPTFAVLSLLLSGVALALYFSRCRLVDLPCVRLPCVRLPCVALPCVVCRGCFVAIEACGKAKSRAMTTLLAVRPSFNPFSIP
jgi:hypothetical protein